MGRQAAALRRHRRRRHERPGARRARARRGGDRPGPGRAVVTNIELDHHATYGSEDELVAAFGEFAGRAQQRIAWSDAPLDGDARRYGIEAGDLQAVDVELLPGGSRFTAAGVVVELRVPG